MRSARRARRRRRPTSNFQLPRRPHGRSLLGSWGLAVGGYGSWEGSSYGALEIGERGLELVDGVERAEPHVARGLQRLEQRGDARLAQLIGILRELFDLLRLRNDLVPVAHEQLPLRLRAQRRR